MAADAPQVVTVGAATVDRHYAVTNLPAPDGGAYAPEVTERPGGVAANVARGVDRLGRSAGIVTRLGEDGVGDTVADRLDEGPLDTTHVRRGPEASTHCVVLRADDGTRSIVTAGDSVRAMTLRPSDRSYLAGADAVFVTAYAPDRVHRTLADWADDDGFPPVVFDLSGPRSELADRGAREASVDRWVETAALFVTGRVAAESYLGVSGEAAAERLRDRGVARAAVTSGPAGATLVADGLVSLPAFDVDVVDETGAGDAFVAGLTHAWLLGDRGPRRAGRFAAATAALSCTAAGASGGLPTADRVAEFLADR